MPSKYSHNVVLAGYSSRGLISLPNSQHLPSFDAYHAPRPASQLLSGTRANSNNTRQLEHAFPPNRVTSHMSLEHLLTSNSRRKRGNTHLYYERQRRTIIDSDSDSEYDNPQLKREPSDTQSSHSSKRSHETMTRSQASTPITPEHTYKVHHDRLDTRHNLQEGPVAQKRQSTALAHNSDKYAPPLSDSKEPLSRQDSAATIETQIWNPKLPSDPDFDGFSDTSEPDFIQRLVVTDRGSTSKVRHSFKSPPPVGMEPEIEPDPLPPLPKPYKLAEPRHTSRNSRRGLNSDLQPLRSLHQYNSLDSMSSLNAASTGDFGIPSIIRTPKSSKKPQSRAVTPQLERRRSEQQVSDSYHPQLTTDGDSDVDSLRRLSNALASPEIGPKSPSGNLESIFYSESQTDDEEGMAAAADHLKSMRRSLSMAIQNMHMRPESRLETYYRDASTDLDDDEEEDEQSDSDQTSVAFPPDIVKYKVRNGITSPMAQIEQVFGPRINTRYGRRKEERIREAEQTQAELKGTGRQKEKSSRGFLKKLRDRSIGRTKK